MPLKRKRAPKRQTFKKRTNVLWVEPPIIPVKRQVNYGQINRGKTPLDKDIRPKMTTGFRLNIYAV